MFICLNHTLLVPTLGARSIWALVSTLNQKIKLAEVPDICASEEWNKAIQQGRSALQECVKTHENLKVDHNQNLASLATVIRRLRCASRNSDHLINTFKYLVGNDDETASLLRWPGLTILMLSQGIGYPFKSDNFISKRLEEVIWSSQVVLAEIINSLQCSLIFRKENIRVSSSKKVQRDTTNEVDRLITSYFTSSCIYKLSSLKNHKVVFLMSDVLESLAKTRISSSSFSLMFNKYLWEYETFHSQGTLLANGCQAALELAGHDDKLQDMAFEFGHLFALAIKANADIQQLYDYQTNKSSFLNISGFPVTIHLQSNPETFQHIYYNSADIDNLHIYQVNTELISSSSSHEARCHLEDYVSRILEILQNFPFKKNSEMIQYLMKLVRTLSVINDK